MRKIRLYTAVILALALVITLCSCKKKAETTNSVPQTAASANDEADPENTEKSGEQGTEIEIKKAVIKEGCANGIDVSKWQGKINWKAVKAAGIDFAIIRIGFRGENGNIYKDDCADYNIQQAEKNGVLVGVYFFSTAVNTAEAEEEAKWTVNAVSGYPISYPVVYDCEGFLNSESRMYGVTNAARTDNAAAFLKYVTESGYEGMLYSAKSELENSKYWDTPRIEGSFKIWVARYPAAPYPETDHPDYTGDYDMWQYTDNGSINGVSGKVDLNISYFTRNKAEAKNANARPQSAAAPEESNGVYTAANDEVTAKIEVNLRDSATTKGNIIDTLKNGTFLKRTGIGSNGWSRLNYNGKTVYAITSYLTADKNYSAPSVSSEPSDGFKAADGQVTAKEETNLRAEPSTAAQLVATIKNGEFVTRTGENPNGWTRLLYNGQTVYAKTSLLTTEVKKPQSSEVQSSAPSDGFTAAGGRFTAKEETNLRTAPKTEGSSVVYTLKRGEFAERIGYNSQSGWTKLLYNGQTVYAITSYLITEEDYNTVSGTE